MSYGNPRPLQGGAAFTHSKKKKTPYAVGSSGQLQIMPDGTVVSRYSQARMRSQMSTSMSSSSSKDFIRINAERAIHSRARRPAEVRRVDSPHGTRVREGAKDFRSRAGYGRIPAYMRKRREEGEAEDRAVEEKVEEIVQVEERMRYSRRDRVTTLTLLRDFRRELETTYQGLPLLVDTPHAKRRKERLEGLMDEAARCELILTRSEEDGGGGGKPLYKSDVPPQGSELRAELEARRLAMEERLEEEEEEEEQEQGVDYSQVW